MAVQSYLKIMDHSYHLLHGLFLALSSAWCDPHGVAVTTAPGFAPRNAHVGNTKSFGTKTLF